MLHEVCYVSCNSNSRFPTVVHWGKNNLICYGSCNAVVIYDPTVASSGKVTSVLVEHTDTVRSVRWIRGVDTNCETELVSGGADGKSVVWSKEGDTYVPTVLDEHKLSVTLVDGLYKGPGNENTVVVSVSSSDINVWRRKLIGDRFVLNQKIELDHSLCVGMRTAFLPFDGTRLILACGMTTFDLRLYIEDEDEFQCGATLLGHEDWVRGLDFVTDDKGDLLLASGSQDNFIRIWRITEFLPVEEAYYSEGSLYKIQTTNKLFYAQVDSILSGHEGWVLAVNWNPEKCQLLSAAVDRSMIIWELDPQSKLWLEKIRVGGIGGNTLGFFGGMFGPGGKSILAHAYNGTSHIWHLKGDDDHWTPGVTFGGHFDKVSDLAWEPINGEFVVSVSQDMTTRVHAPWSRPNVKPITWHEIARPQVHGYEMNSLAMLSRYRFASSAEEKVIRLFEAPKNFVENFYRLCRPKSGVDDISSASEGAPEGASVPSLGLSNKAVFTKDITNETSNNKDPYLEESHFTAVTLTEPPTEETLSENTLWPEMQKLYGHGYEVFSLACSPDGKFLASACKAKTPEHAAILLWDTSQWKIIQKLMSHTLTVVQLAFSPDSQHLLSVSRDRRVLEGRDNETDGLVHVGFKFTMLVNAHADSSIRWSLFTKNPDSGLFELVATVNKSTSIHTRIIWCCAWSHDSRYFATGSRDGNVVIWTKKEEEPANGVLGQYRKASSEHLTLKGESATAVAFAPILVDGSYLIAVGLEFGIIQVYRWSVEKGWSQQLVLDRHLAHHLTVRRLAFRPVLGQAGDENADKSILQLASCGDDSSVKIHNLKFDELLL